MRLKPGVVLHWPDKQAFETIPSAGSFTREEASDKIEVREAPLWESGDGRLVWALVELFAESDVLGGH